MMKSNSYDKSKQLQSFKFLTAIGTKFIIDGFTQGHVGGTSAYFLSHFHADHYSGLGRKFSGSPIFCSFITAALCQIHLHVPASILHPLPLNEWISISAILPRDHLEPQIDVVLVDANHCPGAVMFLFKILDPTTGSTRHILHTGDFRACPEAIIRSPFLAPFLQLSPNGVVKNEANHDVLTLDTVYLDTTYGSSPYYSFPSQKEILALLCDEVRKIVIKENRQRLVPISYLITVGTYNVGKEKVLIELASALSTRIWTSSPRKRAILDIVLPKDLLGDDPLQCQIHAVSMADLDDSGLSKILDNYRPHYTHILAVRPTGWSFKDTVPAACNRISKKGVQPRHKGRISLIEVPYSEHSSFEELRTFLLSFRIGKVIPTVPINGDHSHNIALHFPVK